MKTFVVASVPKKLAEDLIHKINFKTKPLGALGQLEEIAIQIGLIQNTLLPHLKMPHLIVFAADHGIAVEGVSAYPQEVTYQMVLNFLKGGAAINVFCKQHQIALKIVDAGVNHVFTPNKNITNQKMGMGTQNFLLGPAMSLATAEKCIDNGANIVNEIFAEGCNIVGFGEMGIGNTSSASALMSVCCGLSVRECVGKGTGLDEAGIENKISIIEKAIAFNDKPSSAMATLATFGGFEIAQMCGAMLQAAEHKMIILVDGFIATAAFLIAAQMKPEIVGYAIFCHQSNEQAHAKMLRHINGKTVLNLNLRLGEGTGAALAYPLIESAVLFLNEMASFESAGVSKDLKVEV